MSDFFSTRATEVIAEAADHVHPVSCLRRKDVAVFKADRQLEWPYWSSADKTGVRFRGSKGDQMRKKNVAPTA